MTDRERFDRVRLALNTDVDTAVKGLTDKQAGEIWEIANLDITAIRAYTGLSQVKFGERFLIPERTVQHWEAGDRECPIYLKYALAKLTGYIK